MKTMLGSSLVTEPRKCHCACSKGALATWQLSAWSAASGCVMKATNSLIGVSAVSSTTHRVSETCVKAVDGTSVWPGTKQQNDISPEDAWCRPRRRGLARGGRRDGQLELCGRRALVQAPVSARQNFERYTVDR